MQPTFWQAGMWRRGLRSVAAGIAALGAAAYVLVIAGLPAQAQSIPLIRDAEIERDIRDLARPIWEAAKLDPDAINVHIVNDSTLNAFVAGGQRIFVHTGLLRAVDDPNQLIGVIAHETGHITGGHLARSQEAMQDATTVAILSMLAGVATMAAGGGDAGAAIMASSGQFAGRNFMAYSRTQESAADQAALTFLEATGQSGEGLIEFLEHLGEQEALLVKNQDPYARSHPITRERVSRLRQRAQSSPHWDAQDSEEKVVKLKRMQAKLIGYMEPKRALQKYSADDTSLEARYARAFGLYRQALTDKALETVNGLLEDYPQDPYFYELKGQILFESGQAEAATTPLAKAVTLLPDEALLRILYARALVATDKEADSRKAIDILKIASRIEEGNATVWHILAQAYHQIGEMAKSDLAAAERYLRGGQTERAVNLAKRASDSLEKDTPMWWRAQDIVAIAKSNGKLEDE